MSSETMEWLNTMTLIGFTDKRGRAWHYKESAQGDEPNHYPGPVPVADVARRLFNFTVSTVPVFVAKTTTDPEFPGLELDEYVQVPGIVVPQFSDTLEVVGRSFSEGWVPHQLGEWLTENVALILGGDVGLGIGSAGLLAGRARAWIQVEVPENLETKHGVTFRPNLLAATSFDGSLATTYKRTSTVVVCDNTLALGLGERSDQYKVKHSKYSGCRLADAREALALIVAEGQDMTRELDALCETKVSERQWAKVLDALVPMPDEAGRAMTLAETKRSQLESLWCHDNRAATWHGTAFGVLQAFNTWDHHLRTVKGGEGRRAERNMSEVLGGVRTSSDGRVLEVLAEVLA